MFSHHVGSPSKRRSAKSWSSTWRSCGPSDGEQPRRTVSEPEADPLTEVEAEGLVSIEGDLDVKAGSAFEEDTQPAEVLATSDGVDLPDELMVDAVGRHPDLDGP